jgi:hypothetical protein
MRGKQKKKIREIKFEKINDAADSYRVAYWRAQGASLRCHAYSWGHRLKIVVYLAETEIYLN